MSASQGTELPAAPDSLRLLEEALRREQKKVALVQEVSRALSDAGDLDALLTLIMAKVTELMDADRSTLYLVTEDGGWLWSKVVQWSAFARRLRVAAPPDLAAAVERIAGFALPVFAAAGGEALPGTRWVPGRGWDR